MTKRKIKQIIWLSFLFSGLILNEAEAFICPLGGGTYQCLDSSGNVLMTVSTYDVCYKPKKGNSCVPYDNNSSQYQGWLSNCRYAGLGQIASVRVTHCTKWF